MGNITKKISVALAIITISIATICLCSCNAFSSLNPADIEKTQTTAYFAEVNTIVKQFSSKLSDFQTDVKEKNVDAMQNKLKDTQSLIDQFSKLDTPPNCEDVQKNYTDAFVQLQQALSDYVQIFSDLNSGQIDNSVLNERIANVQKSYTQGIELLHQADKLATEK